MLKTEEMTRYSRQLCLRDWGKQSQLRLKEARVLVIGAGGLGSPALYYLAAAGVGHLGVADSDAVELSNLQRQILFGTGDVGRPKVEVVRDRLSQLNPEIEISAHRIRASDENIDELIAPYDLIIDATDGFESRYTIHDACFRVRKPYIYGAVDRFEGRLAVFFHSEGSCCRCLFPASSSMIQNCGEAGVLGVLPGVIGTLQATEALKILTGIGQPLDGKLLVYDALSMDFRTFDIPGNPECPLCGMNPETAPARFASGISARILREKLAQGSTLRLIDVREKPELASGTIHASMHIPLSELSQRILLSDFDQETILYCQRGKRSVHALALFRKAGFRNVRHLEGGIQAYLEAIETGLGPVLLIEETPFP